MKAEILKISGCKTEAEFYKKYPTQEAFLKKHPEMRAKLKKAQDGVDTKYQLTPYGVLPANTYDLKNLPFYMAQGGAYVSGIDPTTGMDEFGNKHYTPFENDIPNPLTTDVNRQLNKGMIDPSTANLFKPAATAPGAGSPSPSAKGTPFDMAGALTTGIGAADKIVSGLKALKGEKQARKSAEQWKDVSDVSLKAFNTKDVNARQDIADTARRSRKALMPTITGESLFPVYGVGTNVLTKYGGRMDNGGRMGPEGDFLSGHPGGEIQNTYEPYDLYKDSGYEPMEESEIIKAYQAGGFFGKNFFGTGSFGDIAEANSAGATSLAQNLTGNNAGSEIGEGVGDLVGLIPGVGPVASAIAKPVFSAIGGLMDRNPQRTAKFQRGMMNNIGQMSGMGSLMDYRTMHMGSFEEGGNLTNPQLITHFGEHRLSDLLRDDEMMNTLRTGGNIRANMVGDVEAVSGGQLEPMSYNPHTPGSGITSKIRGQSHDEYNGAHSGVIINYGKAQDGSDDNTVEAERGELITEQNEDGENKAVITGDQTFGKFGKSLFPDIDNEYVGMKVKQIHDELAKKDARMNNLQRENTKELKNFNPITPFDNLKMNSLSMNEKGIQDTYLQNARKVQDLIEYQDAFNDMSKIYGVDAGELSRHKIKPRDPEMAKSGGRLKKAQDSATITKEEIASGEGGYGQGYKIQPYKEGAIPYTLPDEAGDIFNKENYANKWVPKVDKAFSDYELTRKLVNDIQNYKGEGADAVKLAMSKEKTLAGKIARAHELATDRKVGPYHRIVNELIDKHTPTSTVTETTTVAPKEGVYETTPYRKSGLETLLGQALPWFRKTPGEPLLGDQLAGEMYAMANNQVEPVQARFYHPELDVPYDISLQDKLNENTATFRNMSRMMGGNPEALASLAGNKYMADSNVLGEQFRMNQAKKDQVYSQNRAALNDAQLKNLAIADTQYGRQAQAKSNTKALMQEALNSVASKIGQNRLENRTLQTYANMFPDFSYDKNYRIRHTGAPASFEMPVVYNANGDITHKAVYDKSGNIVDYKEVTADEAKKLKAEQSKNKKSSTEEAVARFGGNIAKAFKNF
jgi:hypothetical protein